MSKPEILSEESLDLVEVKKLMAKVKRRDEELNFRASRLENYLNQFAKMTQKDATALQKEITDLDVPRLKKEHIDALVTFLPTSPEDFKVVMQSFSITINKENREKILEVIAKHA
jgi:DNA-directed RNA polymerase subunit F